MGFPSLAPGPRVQLLRNKTRHQPEADSACFYFTKNKCCSGCTKPDGSIEKAKLLDIKRFFSYFSINYEYFQNLLPTAHRFQRAVVTKSNELFAAPSHINPAVGRWLGVARNHPITTSAWQPDQSAISGRENNQ
jgi:hypothetical protein